MRALIQRVSRASVTVEHQAVGAIDRGLLVFLGVGDIDCDEDLDYLVQKVCGLRIFEDSNGKMNLSVMDVGGSILVVSQFTLYADTRKGKRPSFTSSAPPDMGESYYRKFIDEIKKLDVSVSEGIFGANMKVSLINDGPVTIMIDSRQR